MEKVLVKSQLCLRRLSMNGNHAKLAYETFRAIAGVLVRDYVPKLCLYVQSISWYTATTKAQMDCSFHKEKCNSSWIMGQTTR